MKVFGAPIGAPSFMAINMFKVHVNSQVSTTGAILTFPFGDISESRLIAESGVFFSTGEEKRYPYLYGFTQDGFYLAWLC